MNTQEVFDRVTTHLLTQNKKSMGFDMGCRYRTSDGLKCAIGCLIADEYYQESLEGRCALRHEVMEAVRKSTKWSPDAQLLGDLQDVHDFNFPDAWKGRLKIVAEKFNLKFEG